MWISPESRGYNSFASMSKVGQTLSRRNKAKECKGRATISQPQEAACRSLPYKNCHKVNKTGWELLPAELLHWGDSVTCQIAQRVHPKLEC